MKAQIIKTNGNIVDFQTKKEEPSLKELQEVVGGKIKFVFLSNGDAFVVRDGFTINADMVCNGKATNMLAKDGQKGFITGNALLIKDNFIH